MYGVMMLSYDHSILRSSSNTHKLEGVEAKTQCVNFVNVHMPTK